MKKKLISRSFFERDTHLVAQDLLGKIVVRVLDGKVIAGKIVETEAYTSQDPACHAFRGKTERTAPLFERVGHTYVYFIYSSHFCLNIVSRNPDIPAGGVLLRALEPVAGINDMQELRPQGLGYNLTNGPGKLTQAMAITKDSCSRIDVTQSGSLYVIDAPEVAPTDMSYGPRVGISAGREIPWRFWITGNPWVSKSK